jgi:hypothetical protein
VLMVPAYAPTGPEGRAEGLAVVEAYPGTAEVSEDTVGGMGHTS